MADSGTPKGTFRSKMHEIMRASILDAARERAANSKWASVRISDIAEDVGVSRQTVYNEFGAKEELAQALFQNEVDFFTAGILERIEGAPDIPTALIDTFGWVFESAENHAIIQRMILDARQGASGNLLPMLTVRSDGVLLPVRALFLKAFTDRWPADDMKRAEQVIDLVIRMVISEIVMPSDQPRQDIIRHMVAMTAAVMKPAHADPERAYPALVVAGLEQS